MINSVVKEIPGVRRDVINHKTEITQTSKIILKSFWKFVFELSNKNHAEQIKKIEFPKIPHCLKSVKTNLVRSVEGVVISIK